MYTHRSKKKKRNQILNKKKIKYIKKIFAFGGKERRKVVCERTKNIENFLLHSQMLRDCDTV